MKNATATLSNFRQAPRKMRMVANAIRGKKVDAAIITLDFMAKKASLPIKNLIISALANAKNLDIPSENLMVKTIKVDSGSILYRRQPAAHGSAHPLRKRTSAIFVELGEVTPKKGSSKPKAMKTQASATTAAPAKKTKKTIK
jgi:large subunit ribosomal protein L22